MMDTIFIRGMIVEGCHGVGAKERAKPQRFGVDIEVKQEVRDWKDNIRNTYNYIAARDIIHRYVEEHSFKLIETLAERIGAEILMDPKVKEVSVTVRKLDIFSVGEGGVTITRGK